MTYIAEMESAQPTAAHALFRFNARLIKYLSEDCLGGPRVLKLAWVINLQKATIALFVLALMVAYDNFSAPAWTYLALHGSYGLIWLMKHYAMPDPRWETRVTFAGGLNTLLLVLLPYWVAPVLLISDILGPERALPSTATMAGAVALHTFGVVLMMTSDAQKYFTLRAKRGLITDGLFAHVRHPNYLGEMMLYASYAWLSMHWLPWVILAWVWGFVFLTFIKLKEASMSRYPEWAAYRARTGMLLPWPFGRVAGTRAQQEV